MFMFNWCTQCGDSSSDIYEIIQYNNKNNNQTQRKKLYNFDNYESQSKSNISTQILQIKQSQYSKLIQSYLNKKQKWFDTQFPASIKSFGFIDDYYCCDWKRISQIIIKPQLFDGQIHPKDIIQGNCGDCYFLSALAVLAQVPSRILKVFGSKKYQQNGIYMVKLRINGKIQEIIVDDFIPVNQNSQPLFCQPNKNQFWVIILEKAWAKANSNYASILTGSPIDIFKAITYAPSELYFTDNNNFQNKQKLWSSIIKNIKLNRPCCCGTDDNDDIDWKILDLIPAHAYTLIDAVNLKHQNGQKYRILKLRNQWGQTKWQGQANQFDEQFWSKIEFSQNKHKFLRQTNIGNDGIFYILFKDYCKYFSQTHFSLMQPNASYISQQLESNGKNGQLLKLQIYKNGQYTIQLHQSSLRAQNQYRQSLGLCRGNIIIVQYKQNEKNLYEFIDGIMKYNEQDINLCVNLKQGIYLIYCKFNLTINGNSKPTKSSISIYSKQICRIKKQKYNKYKQFLKNVFLNYANKHIRIKHNNNLMWISWKLMFQQGGFGFIVMNNSKQSQMKYILKFQPIIFQKMFFKLKKPYKNIKQNQIIITVMPGQQKILLIKVHNTEIKSLKFPPSINLKLQNIS